MVSERSSLLESEAHLETGSIDDTRSTFTVRPREVKGSIIKRVLCICLLGIIAIITRELFFLPRTSPSRDFRRWNSLHFTRSDVKRIFLVQSQIGAPGPDGNTIEQNVQSLIKQLSAINRRSPTVALTGDGSGSRELTSFIENKMRGMNFDVNIRKYPVSGNLKVPISSSLQLVDAASSRVLYTADLSECGSKTPAFYPFGKNGSVRAGFLYINNADSVDFQFLMANSISLRHKIAVFAHTIDSDYSLEDKIAKAEELGCAGVVVYGSKDYETVISREYKPSSPLEPRFRIPVSYKAIQPILQTLEPASSAISTWGYRPSNIGAPLELIITSHFSCDELNVTNIVATIEGTLKDSVIVIGASRDTLTSSNPLSGQAIMLEVMQRFSFLQKKGWKPLRSIKFISWDASRSGALGSLDGIKDNMEFPSNLPILAYINLDLDVVTGSHFTVDSSPLFNKILHTTADLIPFPKNSTYYKRLVKDSMEQIRHNALTSDSSNTILDTFHKTEQINSQRDIFYDDKEVSLLQYWLKQDRAHINNKLGFALQGKDAGIFESHADTPVVNLRFSRSPKFNDTLYVPESESYSAKWALEDLDPHLDLHSSLVRFVGLLSISLSEHEVVVSNTSTYFSKVQEYWKEIERLNEPLIKNWQHYKVTDMDFEKTEMCHDIKESKGLRDKPVLFQDVVRQFDTIIQKLAQQALIFDQYNQEVESSWTTDYPWYKMIRKIHIYAKFKVTNYKLLRIEKELNQVVDWLEKDTDTIEEKIPPHHFMYTFPRGIHDVETKKERGVFSEFYEAFETESMDAVVRLAAAKYERLKAVYKKII